ncbi:hypothetical protein HD554DRAFT_2106094 [Boletus coccyginus]|nr:hypothetical protein HD554DRAFT_2106094 [Boletus coccyginus]
MLTSTSSRLCRLLLSLVVRLRAFRLSPGRIALALRSWFAPLWTSILTFARRKGWSQIRLHVNDVPVVGSNSPMGELLQISEGVGVGEGHRDHGTLATFHSTDPQLEIPAGQQKLLSALPPLPDEWKRHVHPKGNVLFYHEGLRIFTESDIFHREKDVLFCATKLIQEAIQTDTVTLDELTEIVVNVDNSHNCHYYFVDHTHRLLFWLVPRNMKDIGANLQGITEYSHIRYIVESRYWSHCEYYPLNRILPKGVFEELRGMLNHFKTDMITADSSTSPFTQDTLAAILDIVNSLKDDNSQSSVWVVARLMAYLTENQFLNFYGQPCARLNANTPLLGEQTSSVICYLFAFLNGILFGVPTEYALRLQRIFVDSITTQPRWKEFVARLRDELGQYTIISTVMLAVNFSFLAVPGVVSPASGASQVEFYIYCSAASSLASIIFSLSLLNVHSNQGVMVTRDLISTLNQTGLGMAFLAIMYSLPIFSLLYSIGFFSAALVTQISGPEEFPVFLGIEFIGAVWFWQIIGMHVLRFFYSNYHSWVLFCRGIRIMGSRRDIERGSES